MKLLALILLLSLPAASLSAGTIVGTVTAQGKSVPSGSKKGDYGSRKYKFLKPIDYRRLRDFVVYINQPMPAYKVPEGSPTLKIVTHKNATFDPHVLPLQVGSSVDWPNQDDIYHNAFSLSNPNDFDLGLYKDEIKQVEFVHPGRVDVFCSIHKDMHCIILVLENPFFAVVDTGGKFRIENVPAGTYPLRAWHERMPAQEKTVDVPATGEVAIDFEMSFKSLPKP